MLVDSVLVLSPGGERLQIELSAALGRTRPPGAELTVLCRRNQRQIVELRDVASVSSEGTFANLFDKWRWMNRGLPHHVERIGASVTFEASGLVSGRLCRRCGVVTTTNNMLAFAPELMAPVSPMSPEAVLRRVRRAMIVSGLRRADAVILHSKHALRTVTPYAGDISAKTTVVHTGVPSDASLDADHTPPHPNDGKPYFFYLSVVRAPKNQLRLIEAYRRLRQRSPDVPELVLAGFREDGAHLQAVLAAIDAAGPGGGVRCIGELDREAIPGWLHHAECNVFPSLAETNSVIVTEILGMHGVLAASDIPPIREVAGEAAVYFDPLDAGAITAVLEELSNDPERRRRLRAAAAGRAADLSWNACGEAIWSAAGRVHADRLGGASASG